MAALDGVTQLAPFDCKSDSNIGAIWRRWKRSFDYFVLAKNVTDPAQQKALLLLTAGIDVQDNSCSGQLLASGGVNYRWRRGVAVERRIRDREVAGSSLGRALRRKNSGQVSHTYG